MHFVNTNIPSLWESVPNESVLTLAGFELFEELPTPKFSFGGRSGNSVAALVFQKT